jgi:oligopeptidase B
MNRTLPPAPIAPRKPHTTRIHDTELHDDYGWLRDKGSPEVTAYLEAENAYTAAAMQDTAALQTTLYDEILSHIKEDDVSVPYRDGDWIYLTRTAKGSQYGIYLRRPASVPDAPEEVILDVNHLSEGQPYMSLGSIAVSPNGHLLAYTTDNTGFRQYTLHIRDLTTGQELSDTAERVGSLVWTADSAHIFFTTEDDQTKRQDQVHRLALGHPPVLVFEEKDERFNLGVGRTSDRKYILLDSGSHTTNEVHILNASTPDDSFQLFAPRIDEEEYHVDYRDGYFYIHTNHKAEFFRLMVVPLGFEDADNREFWRELLPENKEAPLEDFDLFQNFLVTTYREAGLPVLRVFSFNEDGTLGASNDIRFPDPAYAASGDVNRDFNTTVYRYAYQSLVRPASIFEYDVATQTSTLLKQQEVPGGFDAELYASERLWFPATDGTKVPISLIYRRDSFHKDGKSPLYVYGYGSYGYALPLGFSPARLSLLDRGIVIAYAHIRGGGELGDPWHDAGKMMTKLNTFTDFIDATEFLTHSGYGDPARVAIEGGSAGGLLMGAVVNQRPGLFRAVLSHVPFVDVMNTMLDATLPLTVAEYEEWGNPNEPAAFAYMRSYSPYENLDTLDPTAIPAMLVKTSLNDSQVMYWEPAKYVAKLRTLKTNETPLLLHINMDAGHGGASGRYDYLKEIAFDYAFLLRELGIETPTS